MSNELKNAVSLLRTDFERYARVNLKIVDKSAQKVPFVFNRMQRRLWKLYQQDVASGKPVRWFVFKSRQEGSTTFFLGLGYWRTTLNRNQTSLIVNYDLKAVENLGGKLQNFYFSSQEILRPTARKMNRAEIHFATPVDVFEKTGDVGLDSRFIFASADGENLGRSYTFSTVILSEFALWEDLGIDVEKKLTALNSAIPETPGSFVVMETTPFGEGYAKDFWEDEGNGYRKIFISWVADDSYRLELSDEDFKLFEYYCDKDSKYGDERREADLIRDQLKFWFPEQKDDLVWLDRETTNRLAWRRMMIDKKQGGKKELFDQEYPTSPEKMFASSGASIFGAVKMQELLRKHSNNLKSRSSRYTFDEDADIKNSLKAFYKNPGGHLTVHEESVEGCTYVVGGDGAQGIEGADPSSLVVLRLPELTEVASFNDVIRPDIFAKIAYHLATLYNNALLAIEVNDKGGYAAVDHLQNTLSYKHLYYTGTTASDIRYGWITNKITRQIMINDLKALVEEDHIFINTFSILDQMNNFVKGRNGKIAARSGKKDDLVLSLMIAVQLASISGTMIKRPSLRPKSEKYSVDWWAGQYGNRKLGRKLALAR